jgi:kynurenine 3-monooxygenase
MRLPLTCVLLAVLSSSECLAFSSRFLSPRVASPLSSSSSVERTVQRSVILRQSTTTTTSTTPAGSSINVPSESSLSFLDTVKPQPFYDAIVCGGGPAGLLTALMLTQKFGPSYKIAVCERRAAIPPSPSDETVWNDVARFYLLGIGHRGQRALETFGVYDDFVKASVAVQGRRDWQPGQTKPEEGKTTLARKNVTSRILARDKLVGVLHEHLVEKYIQTGAASIDLLYGYEIQPMDFGASSSIKTEDRNDEDVVSVRITKCQDASPTAVQDSNSASYTASQDAMEECDVESSQLATTKLLIGADGAARTVADAMERVDRERYARLNPLQKLFGAKKPFGVTQFVDDNPRVYKSVPIRLPSDWPQPLNYSARSNRITLEALPSDNKGNLCALLLIKPEDELAQANVEPAKLRHYFDEHFPQFGALVNDEEMARVAQKPASRLPVFRYAGPRLHLGRRTLVLGDAAHTVKPYYGLGANTALEDVEILSEIIEEGRMKQECSTTTNQEDLIPHAVQEFSKRRAADSEALVTISRNMDRPGKLFFFTFLLPLILDGMFHKIAPAIFSENIFGMFQKKNIGFKQIQTKKRLDRVLQIVCLTALATGAGRLVKAAIGGMARLTGQSPKVVSLSLLLVGVLASLYKKYAQAKQQEVATKKTT